MLGSSHSYHRALHCLAAFLCNNDAILAHWFFPYFITAAFNISSYSRGTVLKIEMHINMYVAMYKLILYYYYYTNNSLCITAKALPYGWKFRWGKMLANFN